MKTTFPISAPPEAWAALADPMRLAAALPGCRSVTGDAGGDGTLQVVTEVAVAAVRGLWAGTVAPVDADAVRVRGSGAPGAVDLTVRADPERTALTVEGTVDGALGTVGSAVLAAAVRRMAEDLLAAATEIPEAQPAPPPPVIPAGLAAGTTIPAGKARGVGRRRVVGTAVTVAGVGVAAALAGRRRRAQRGAS
ncbi:MAG: SRPBCC domain-containing protein [Acidimicrobiales bacterium]